MSVDPELLDRALTHRSYAYEQGGLPTNERLEFLGDSVLGLVVTEHLFVTYPDLSEGQLAKLRAAVVNSRALADIARKLDLGAVIHLGRGEESTGGRDKSSILADTMEAVIGAVFLQHGIDAARAFVHHLFDPLMAEVATRGAGLDWKTSLQEIASMSGLGVPVYDVVESGPDHAKTFQATVHVKSGRGTLPRGTVELNAPAGWEVGPAKRIGPISSRRESTVTFDVTPPDATTRIPTPAMLAGDFSAVTSSAVPSGWHGS